MSNEIKMPMLSPTMTKGVIAQWLVAVGDSVVTGDILLEIEADKVIIEIEAEEDGVVSELCAQEGDEVPVDDVIIRLAAAGTVVDKADKVENTNEAKIVTAEPQAAEIEEADKVETLIVEKSTTVSLSPTVNEQMKMSPLARRMAVQQQIDATRLPGSGPNGKIMKRDIELSMGVDLSKPLAIQINNAAPVIGNPVIDYQSLPEFTRTKNSGMRSVVATRLTQSSRDIPHFYMSVDCEIDTLLAMRKRLNQRNNANYKISVNDFVIKSVAMAMKTVPEANCMWDGDSIIHFDQVDISVAVAVEDGLITPVVRKACSNGLATISNNCKELVVAAREGKLKPQDYQGGTFTISNLGMFGIDNFTSIINPPQNGILSVGAGEQRAVVKDGELRIATVMTVTLAMDHRCVDGATGARFIQAFKEIIEDPIPLML